MAVHPIQGLQRSRLVLLHFLGPAISEGCPRLLHEADWRDGLDTLPNRRHRQPGGRSRVHRIATLRSNTGHHAAHCHSYFLGADDLRSLRGDSKSAAGCIALISVATFGYTGALANLLAIPGDVFPKGAVASIWGFASMGAGFGGMIFSLVTGWLVQRYSFQPAFVLFGIIPLISAWLVWTLPATEKLAPVLSS